MPSGAPWDVELPTGSTAVTTSSVSTVPPTDVAIVRARPATPARSFTCSPSHAERAIFASRTVAAPGGLVVAEPDFAPVPASASGAARDPEESAAPPVPVARSGVSEPELPWSCGAAGATASPLLDAPPESRASPRGTARASTRTTPTITATMRRRRLSIAGRACQPRPLPLLRWVLVAPRRSLPRVVRPAGSVRAELVDGARSVFSGLVVVVIGLPLAASRRALLSLRPDLSDTPQPTNVATVHSSGPAATPVTAAPPTRLRPPGPGGDTVGPCAAAWPSSVEASPGWPRRGSSRVTATSG